MSAIWTVRVLRFITKKTTSRTRPPIVSTSTVKKVGGCQAVPMRGEECLARRFCAALWCGLSAVIFENRFDRIARDVVAEDLQSVYLPENQPAGRSPYARVAI
jgi:hypothetical protein